MAIDSSFRSTITLRVFREKPARLRPNAPTQQQIQMNLERDKSLSVQSPQIEDAARLATALQDFGIPSALWGVNAAGCYGGGLCPLVCSLHFHQNGDGTHS